MNDEMQQHFMVKHGIEGNFLNLLKIIYKKQKNKKNPAASIIPTGEKIRSSCEF